MTMDPRTGPVTLTISGTSAALLARLADGDDAGAVLMRALGLLDLAMKAKREGKTFDYRTNERLHKALELKLFEDQKDSIKLTSLVSRVIDKDTQEKIDVVKARLIRDFGYNEQSATDVLNYVASIFARGDLKN